MVKGIQMQAIMVDDNGEKTVGLHTVTGLPTLRQVFRWFEDFSLSCSKNGCLSVTVYEISKYVYILENFGIECVDKMLSVFTRMLQQCWGNGAYIGHISDERLVVMAQFADDNNREDIAAFLEEQNQHLIKEIEKYNITEEEFKNLLIEWLVYYNSKRPHFSLNLKAPLEFLVENNKMSHMYVTNTIA